MNTRDLIYKLKTTRIMKTGGTMNFLKRAGAILMVVAIFASSCNKYADDFKQLNTKLDAVASSVAGLTQLATDVAATKASVTALQTSVAGLPTTASVTALSTSLTAVSGKVDAIATTLSAVAATGTANATAIAAVKTDLAALVASQAAANAAATAGFAADVAKMTALDTKVSAVVASLTAIAAQETALGTAVAGNTTAIAANAASLTALTAQASALATSIASLTTADAAGFVAAAAANAALATQASQIIATLGSTTTADAATAAVIAGLQTTLAAAKLQIDQILANTTPIPVALSALAINGTSASVSTTVISLPFDVDPATLTGANVSVTGATKGALSTSGLTRTLAISGITVANNDSITVTLTNPSGYTITPLVRKMKVYVAPAVVLSSITADGVSGALNSSNLTLTFNVEPVGLLASNLSVTGATIGTLTHTPGTLTYNLGISAIASTVANGGNITVGIASQPAGFNITTTDINTTSKTVAVWVANTARTFSAVSANGTAGTVSTTLLSFGLGGTTTGFGSSNITVTGATKGALTSLGSGNYTLAISGITVLDGQNVVVTLTSPAGYVISPLVQTVVVNVGLAPVTFTGVTGNNLVTITLANGLFKGATATYPNNDLAVTDFTWAGTDLAKFAAGAVVVTKVSPTVATIQLAGLITLTPTAVNSVAIPGATFLNVATYASSFTVGVSTAIVTDAFAALTSASFTPAATDNVVTVTLTGGTFKAAPIVAGDFSFSSAGGYAGAIYTRTSNSVVTITGLTANASAQTILVPIVSQVTPATSVAAVSSAATSITTPAITPGVTANAITVTLGAGTFITATALTSSNITFTVVGTTAAKTSADAAKIALGLIKYTSSTTATLTGFAALDAGTTVRVNVAASAFLTQGYFATAAASTISSITSAVYTLASTPNSLTITLTAGGVFRAGTFSAADFVFAGSNKVTLEGGTFTRTSDTVITVTNLITVTSADNQVLVKAPGLAQTGTVALGL